MSERTLSRRQQLEVQRHAQLKGTDDDDSELDSIATDSTEMSDQDPDKIYDVERIVAETVGWDGKPRYLIMWANYPEDRASWEPPENIVDQDGVIGTWEARREQEKAGKLIPFNLAAWESKQAQLEKEKEERHLRRDAKRRKLRRAATRRKAMAVLDSDDEPLAGRSHKVARPARESDGEEEDDMPIASRRKSIDMRAKKKPEKMKRPRKDSDVESEVASSDSLMGEMREKEARRQARASREGLGKSKPKAIENTRTPSERRRGSDARPNPQRTTDSPDARSPLQETRELPKAPARTASRDSPKVTQAPSMNSSHQGPRDVPPPRPRGRPLGSGRGGATRGGRGRAGRLPDNVNVFSRSEGPKAKARGLTHALSLAPVQPAVTNQPNLSKNLSHARKLEVAGRSKADRAPDLSIIGGLVNPAEAKNSRTAYQQLKPPEPRRTSSTDAILINTSSPVPPAPPRSSTTRVVRFLDDSDDAARSNLETPSPVVENSSLPGRSDRGPPSTVQMFGASGNNQSDASGQAKIIPKPILRPVISNRVSNERPHQPPTQPRVTATLTTQSPNERPLQPPTQPRPDTMPSISSALNISNQSPPVFQAPPQPIADTMLLANNSNHTMPVRPVSAKKKMSLRDYAVQQGIEKSGNLVKQATFGKPDGQIPIAFSGVQRSSQEPWVKDISSVDVVRFSHACLSTHFKDQPPFINAPVLACGGVAANPGATPILERVADYLRLKLGGLIFSHNSVAILLFPTRLEEWKFLEKTDVPNGVALRYHIFKLPEFCPTIAAPCRDDVSQLIPTSQIQPPYWSFAVAFFCALKYESLLPQLLSISKGKQEPQDRDNFFLLIPENATPSPRFLTMWLKSCKPSCKILTSRKPGSWGAFIEHVKKPKSAGAVLIHESFLHVIPKLPDFDQLFSPRSNFAIYSISDCTAPPPSLDLEKPAPSVFGFARTRLFPIGGAYFLAPSILYADPKNVIKFLDWFRARQDRTATPGTYKLLGCHGLRELLLDIANEKASERARFIENFDAKSTGQDVEQEAIKRGFGLNLNNYRYSMFNTVEDMMDKANEKLPPYYDLDDVGEDERPIIYASELIDRNDEPKLIEWFAGWAMQNLDKYKKFWVIGTDPTNVHKAVSLSSAAKETSTTDPASTARPESPKSPFENSNRWKKSGFTAVTEVTPAPLFSTVAPKFLPDAVNNPISSLTSNSELHDDLNGDKIRQENWKLESTIRQFLSETGLTDADEDIAMKYLIDANADAEVAISRYRQSLDANAPSLPRAPATHPQLDGAEQRTNQEAASGSRPTSRPPSRSGAVTEEDGRRHVPASTRSNGSIRPEIEIRPGYVSPEDKEVWRSPSVLSMLPRNVRQNAAAHVTNSRQRPNEAVGRTIRRDESGDVVMSEDNPHDMSSGSPSYSPIGDAALRKESIDSNAMFVSAYSRSQSPSTSPVKRDALKSRKSSVSIEATTEWYERIGKAGEAWNHVKVYGIKTAFFQLGIK